MYILIPLLFFGLSVSVGVKLGLVYRDRFPQNSRILLIAALAQVVLVGYVAVKDPDLLFGFGLLAGLGFCVACLYDWLKPNKPVKKKLR